MNFRNATLDDLPEIVAIYNSTIPGRMVTADTQPVTISDKLEWFGKHSPSHRPLWIVEENDIIIGWVSFQDFYGRPAYSGTAEISLYLHEKFRNKGFGKQILLHSIQASATLQINTLLGFIFSHNHQSIHLFTSVGFEEWGNLKDIAVMDGNKYSLKIFGMQT